MKKQTFFRSTLCLLLTLLCNVAWAQPKASPAPSDGQWADGTTWYQIQTKSGFYLRGDNLDANGNVQLPSSSTLDKAALWCVVGDDANGYTFYNMAVGAETPMCMNNSTSRAQFVALGTDGYTTTFDFVASQKTDANNTYWCVRKHTGSSNTYYWNPQGDPKQLAYWNDGSATNDNGSAFLFTETTEIISLAQLSNNKVYTLSSARAFLFHKEGANKLYSSNGKAAGSVTLDKTEPNHQFRIEKKGDNYYLYSVGAKKYVAKDGTYVATATDALVLTDVSSTYAEYPWKLTLGGNGMNSQDRNQTDEGLKIDSWTDTDPGNCYKIEVAVAKSYVYTIHVLGDDEATVTYNGTEYEDGGTFETKAEFGVADFTPAVVEGKFSMVNIDGNDIYVSYIDKTTQFYTIRGGHNGYLSLSEGYTDGGKLLLSNTEIPKDKKGLWTFVGNSTDGYKIYNYSTGLSKVLGMTGSNADARATMVAEGTEGYTTIFDGNIKFDGTDGRIKLKGSANNYWNKRGNYLALWNDAGAKGDDQGSKFYLDEADYVSIPDEYIHEISDIQGIATFEPKNPNTLWYRTSAEASGVSYPWMEYALPLGNGELGCMVFGGVAHEELQFNEKTLWSGPANTVGAASGNRTFMNFGSLIIANNDASIYTDGVTDYVRYLDIEEGIAGVEFKNANGTKQVRKYLSSAPDQVIAGQYTSEGDDKLNLTFSLEPGKGINASSVVYEGNTASFSGKMTVEYAARLHVVADNGATVTATNAGISVKNATEVTFYLKGGTNFDGNMKNTTNYFTTETAADVNTRIEADIEKAEAKGFDAIVEDHVDDFTAITKRMTLSLGLTTPTVDTKTLIDNYYPNNGDGTSTQNDHLFLEQLYFHYGRYLAISSNRKDIAAPNNLQGIWNDRGSDSPWNSDVHTNINIQMNYWPTEITNLSDLHKPFVNFIIRGAQTEGWKEVGKQYNDGHGWSILTETSLYGSMSTWGDNYLVANVWYTSHLWTHYRYTQDKEFLKEAFPAMWGAAEFWFHRLIEDRGFDNTLDEQNSVKNYHTPYKYEPDGTFVAPNEFSAEQHDNQTEDGTAHAQQMIYYLFTNIKEAIDILGGKDAVGLTDADIAKLDEYLAKTDQGLHTEVYTGAWGNTYNGVNKGDSLLREWKYTPFDISNDRGHRHMSHMMALFPMDQITPESRFFEPAVNSLKLRGDAATGWSMGWKVNLWARAQDGDHAHLIIKNALKHSTAYNTNAGAGGIYYNLFDSHAPFQIDGNFGVCSGIAEMLMQSAHGYINILPALPKVWERTGAITGMKAMGNFTVDFNWENGRVQQVTIVSNAGAPLKVRSARGNIAAALITVAGVEVTAVVENGIATIPCEKGQTVVIDFTAAIAALDEAKATAKTSVAANTENLGGAIGYYSYTVNGKKMYTVEAVNAAIDACEAVEEIEEITGSYGVNLPEVGKKYRFGYDFGGETGVLYIQSVNSSVKGLAMTDEEENNSVFLVEEIESNLRLKSVATGKYLKEDGNTRGLQTVGGNVTFSAGANLGQIKIQASSFLHANSSDDNYFVDHCGSDGGHERHNFVAVEVIDKYAFPENGKTYYIYSDTYHNGAFVNRFLYADGASLKMNTALLLEDTYKWTCTVNEDGSMTFQNGAGKYLGYKVMADAAYNFTVANTSVHNPNAVTLYAKANSRYIVVHNDGSQFNHSTATYNQENDAYCTDFVFIETDNVHLLSVNGDSKVKATATWNNVTKALPASWIVFKGDKIANPTLSVTTEAAYTFNGLYSGDINKGTTVDITALDENLELTAKYSPVFFSTTYGEKWVRLSNCSNNNYWATMENAAAQGKGKTATLDYADEKQLWCLVGTAQSFVLYNKAAGDKLALKVTAATSADGSQATLENDTQASWKLIEQDFGYALVPTHNTNASNLGINMYAGNGGYLKLYGTGAGNKGSYWMVEMADVNKPLTLNVTVDQVWESSPRVAELTFTINGKASQTRILGDVEGQVLYLPVGATYEVSSMTYRGYTYNGCTENEGVLTASYTANDERTLFYSPRDGHPYRIPAIATTPNGDIFAICDYRPCGNDIGYGEVDLVCRVSSDNGVTWTEERTIADGKGDAYAAGDTAKIWQVGFGDPAIVADRESNKVLVMSVCGNQTCWDGTFGEADPNPNRVARLYIEHDGEKWVYGEPEEVTYDLYPKFVDENGNVHSASMFIGAGKICQSRVVKKDDYYRIYCAVWVVTKTQRQHHNYVIYSDDFGQTWDVLGDLGYENSASKWGNEPKVEELPDGTVVLSSRKYNGRYFNLFTFDDDTYTTGSWKGEVGSNEVQGGLSFGGNSTNGEIYKVKAIRKSDGQICDIMLQSIPTGGGRDNVAIYYKEMEYNEDGTNKYTSTTFAQGWTKGIHVSTKGSCYSTMISQADGRIAFFFEEEPSGYCMVYIPYTIEELTGDAYSLYTVNSAIGEYEIGTFYASEAVTIPEGVKAYVATEQPTMENGTGVITMTELEGIIPANTGAVLRGAAAEYKFIPSISYGTAVKDNMLIGYEANNKDADLYREEQLAEGYTTYVLAVENDKAGFYKKEATFKVYNNKAYLQVPAEVAANSLAIRFDGDGTTDIETPEFTIQNSESIFDLMGRRVINPTKGVYIVNGKKVIIR